MISVSDILSLLDRAPIWKTLKDLPKRVDALEAETRSLRARIDQLQGNKPGETCPSCGAPALRRTGSKPTTGHFAGMGLRDETWTCSACGEVDEREMVPAR